LGFWGNANAAVFYLKAHPCVRLGFALFGNPYALHPRNYGRNQDIENPDHLSRLLEERKRGEDAALLARFLALSPKAETYFGALRQRELHAMGHVRRILLLVDLH
jgi:hypothetical protein